MDNILNDENIDLKITPKSEHYFNNKLFNKENNYTKVPLKILDNSIKHNFENKNSFKYNSLIFKRNNTEGISDFYKFNNDFLREACLTSYRHKEKSTKDFGCDTNIGGIKFRRHLKLLEKDVDFHSPEYQRLYSSRNLKNISEFIKFKLFNHNNTYEHQIKNNIKKFLFSDLTNNNNSIKSNNSSNNKNNKINSLNNFKYNKIPINQKKFIIKKKINIKNKPTSKHIMLDTYYNKTNQSGNLFNKVNEITINKNIINKNNKLFYNNIINKNNKYKINFINLYLQLKYMNENNKNNNISDNTKNKNIFYDSVSIRHFNFPLKERNYLFNKKIKISKNKKF